MKLEYVPLLKTQRDLHDIPRGYDRFREYLKVMVEEDGTDLRIPPLVIMNPMGREHQAELLDALLALDADGVAARSGAEAAPHAAAAPGDFKISLVVADDAKGGWTNRFASEFNFRFGTSPPRQGGGTARRAHWLAGVLWTSEPADAATCRERALTAIFRAVHVLTHGPAATLRDKLAQEGYAMAMAGCTRPALDAEDLEYTRQVLAPHLETRDRATSLVCLFGDAAALSLGHRPLGLSPWAGLAVALAAR